MKSTRKTAGLLKMVILLLALALTGWYLLFEWEQKAYEPEGTLVWIPEGKPVAW